MEMNKELFKAFISEEITNEELRQFALYATDKIPEYFWVIPASSSGKYHPVTDLGEGGLVRHSLMVARVAIDMLNTTNNLLLLHIRNEILIACLFHDCCKNGIENSGHTEHTHPLIAGEFLRKTINQYRKDTGLIVPDSIKNIIMLITTHTWENGLQVDTQMKNFLLQCAKMKFLFINVIILQVENIAYLTKNFLKNIKK